MLLPKFDFHEPTSLDEACRILASLDHSAKLIAGGTDLIVGMKKKLLAPKHLVSLSRIAELQTMGEQNGRMVIGPCVTVAALAASDTIARGFSALAAGARSLGSPLVRNRATIGGNLGSARPAADLPPALLAYGADVVLSSTTGLRTVSLKDVFVGPGLTALGPDDILSAIEIPSPPPLSGAGYLNLGFRKTQDCNVVNVASFLALDGADGTIRQARIVMGCVGPTHLRAPSAERMLVGNAPGDRLFLQAATAAMADCAPIDDFRGSADYKRDMVCVLTRRTLTVAWQEALGNRV